MINTNMRMYDFFSIVEDEYGQMGLSNSPVGQIKMSIEIASQNIQDNINYKDCQYVGLTHAKVDDTYVISYGNERLKVLYINPRGKYKQVFLTNAF